MFFYIEELHIMGGFIVAQGEKITVSGGVLNVPNNPVIPFIEGDGTGPDIWRGGFQGS